MPKHERISTHSSSISIGVCSLFGVCVCVFLMGVGFSFVGKIGYSVKKSFATVCMLRRNGKVRDLNRKTWIIMKVHSVLFFFFVY